MIGKTWMNDREGLDDIRSSPTAGVVRRDIYGFYDL